MRVLFTLGRLKQLLQEDIGLSRVVTAHEYVQIRNYDATDTTRLKRAQDLRQATLRVTGVEMFEQVA